MAILVVDDAAIIRVILKDVLTRYCGYSKEDIIEATGGADAIKKYKSENPEFVLCDISIPDMDSAEVVKALIDIDPDAKIIMCTTPNNMEDIEKCTLAGAKDYIVKPPKPESVKQVIEKLSGVSVTSKVSVQENKVKETPSQPNEVKILRQEVMMLKSEIDALKDIVATLHVNIK